MGQGEVKEVVLDELRAYRHCGELRLHFKLQDFKQIKDHIFRREFCPVLSPLAHIWASAVVHGKESACSAAEINPYIYNQVIFNKGAVTMKKGSFQRTVSK